MDTVLEYVPVPAVFFLGDYIYILETFYVVICLLFIIKTNLIILLEENFQEKTFVSIILTSPRQRFFSFYISYIIIANLSLILFCFFQLNIFLKLFFYVLWCSIVYFFFFFSLYIVLSGCINGPIIVLLFASFPSWSCLAVHQGSLCIELLKLFEFISLGKCSRVRLFNKGYKHFSGS